MNTESENSGESTPWIIEGDEGSQRTTMWELKGQTNAEPENKGFDRLGRYRLLHEIGRGGHGIVFAGHDTELNRQVAIKIARPEVASRPSGIERFQAEAQAASRLDHPGIVPVFDCGFHQGLHYYVMPYLPYENLGHWLSRQTSELEESFVAKLIIDLADAVHYGHQNHIIHRDIKPQNILMRQDTTVGIDFRPMLLDFGLCGSIEAPLHSTSMLAGTPRYMSPEQAMVGRRSITARTDIYSLGIVFYELLTRSTPHQPQTIPEAILMLHETSVESPRKLRPKLSKALETICLKCLRTDPVHRYATAKHLSDDLRRFLAGTQVQAKPQRLWERLDFAVRYGDWEARIAWAIIILNVVTYGWALAGSIVIGARFSDRPHVTQGIVELLVFLGVIALPIHALGVWTGWMIRKGTSAYRWLATAAVGSAIWACLNWINFFRNDSALQIYAGQEFAELMVFLYMASAFSCQAGLLSIAAWSAKCRAQSAHDGADASSSERLEQA